MLTKDNFTEEHIRELQKQSKCDPSILERTIFAFGLLEALTKAGMPFIFKGGSSLMLLLEHPRRLSTDIDILVEPGIDFEDYLNAAARIFPFVRREEQPRAKRSGIEKRHFKFSYRSPMTGKELCILLDVVFAANPYPHLIRRSIDNDLLYTEGEPLTVQLPSINCVLGDKLTAFAPHTTGIRFGIGKNMEIVKQFYDVATLLNEFTDFDEMLCATRWMQLFASHHGARCSRTNTRFMSRLSVICVIISMPSAIRQKSRPGKRRASYTLLLAY